MAYGNLFKGDIMKVGDLVRSLLAKNVIGFITEPYDSPKGLWRVFWLDGGAAHQGTLCHEKNMRVIS